MNNSTEEPTDEQLAAMAILETKRHVLSGREMSICEKVINPPLVWAENNSIDHETDEEAEFEEQLDDELVIEELSETRIKNSESEVDVFTRLRTEFSREIGEWTLARTQRIGRERVEAHQRITSRQLLPA